VVLHSRLLNEKVTLSWPFAGGFGANWSKD
jgi:hypothetical protein